MLENSLTARSIRGNTYHLQKELGYGSYSVVFRGTETKDITHEPCALKFPKRETPPRLRITLIEEEATFCKTFNHPNFIRYIDHCVEPRDPYLVIEIVSETIAKRIHQKTITPLLIEQFLTQIPTISQELTTQERIHADLRCTNIAYKNNRFIVLDPLPQISRRKPECKNPPRDYAPEFIRSGILTPAADIFSLGKTLEYMLLQSWKDTPNQSERKKEIEQNTTITKPLKQLVLSMTEHEPTLRPTPSQLHTLCQTTLHALGAQEYITSKIVSA